NLHICHRQIAPLQRGEEFVAARNDPELGEDDDVRVQGEHLLANVGIQPRNDRNDGHHRRHAEDHTQESQKGAELVPREGGGRHAQELARRHEPFSSSFFLAFFAASLSTMMRSPSLIWRSALNGPVTISCPSLGPDLTSIMSSPASPVSTLEKPTFPPLSTV